MDAIGFYPLKKASCTAFLSDDGTVAINRYYGTGFSVKVANPKTGDVTGVDLPENNGTIDWEAGIRALNDVIAGWPIPPLDAAEIAAKARFADEEV